MVWSWRRVCGVHRKLRARRRGAVPPPILVVGSARSGGTCKTDLVAWIAQRFPQVAVLCHPTGDEDRLFAQRFPGRVFVHRDWLRAWDVARSAGFLVAVADGGLQDPALDGCPALRLDVEPAPAGWRDLHPWGPWREFLHETRPARVVSVERDLRPSLSLDGHIPTEGLRAACSVARPEVFFAQLAEVGVRLREQVAMADHRPFPRGLRRRMEADPVSWVVTPKDAARKGLPAGVRVARRVLDPVEELRSWIGSELDRLSPSETGSP